MIVWILLIVCLHTIVSLHTFCSKWHSFWHCNSKIKMVITESNFNILKMCRSQLPTNTLQVGGGGRQTNMKYFTLQCCNGPFSCQFTNPVMKENKDGSVIVICYHILSSVRLLVCLTRNFYIHFVALHFILRSGKRERLIPSVSIL